MNLIGLRTPAGRLIEVAICVAQRRLDQGCTIANVISSNIILPPPPTEAELKAMKCSCSVCNSSSCNFCGASAALHYGKCQDCWKWAARTPGAMGLPVFKPWEG